MNKLIFGIMNKNKFLVKALLLMLFAVVFASNVSAQSIGRVGTTAAPFLKIGVGARALAMGEAVTTQSDDITGMYWNPAGISKITSMQVVFNHYDYIADLTFDYGGILFPIENVGVFGAFIGYLGMPDIERTTITFPEGTGEKVSAGSMVIGLSYGRMLTDRFSLGGNIKYVTEQIWHSSASGFAFDIGIDYTTSFRDLKIGMSISNFGTSMQMDGRDMLIQHDINSGFAGNNENINAHMDTDEFPLPILFRVGLSADIAEDMFELQDYNWIIAIDAIHPNDNKEYLNVGTEVTIMELISLRGGWRQLFLEDAEGGLTLGFGLSFDLFESKIKVDYANVDFGRLDRQDKFTLILSF